MTNLLLYIIFDSKLVPWGNNEKKFVIIIETDLNLMVYSKIFLYLFISFFLYLLYNELTSLFKKQDLEIFLHKVF